MATRLRICMVGAGRVGKLHTQTLTQSIPDVEIAALVDPSAEMREQTGRDFGIEQRYASLEHALARAQFDGVIITTPTFTHRDLVLEAAAARKHVFVEKPMAMTLAECDEMIAATEQHGLVLQIGFMRRYDPDFVAAAERIAAGEIGEPMLIKSLTHGPGLPPAWANDLRTSNGMLAEVNSHDLDCVRWMMDAPIERISVETANFKGAERGATAEHFYDTMLATLNFASGALGSISGICPCDYGYDARVEIVGKRGIMQIGELRGQSIVMCVDREQGLVTPIARRWPERFARAYIEELRDFVRCVRSGAQPRARGVDGRWAVAAVLAGTTSLLEGRAVELAEVLEA